MRQLEGEFESTFASSVASITLPPAIIRERQFRRIKYLTDLAYSTVDFYREKYDSAGFHPDELRTPSDVQRIPIVTKSELCAVPAGNRISHEYGAEQLFHTRSSGSSGQVIPIRVDRAAVITDTVQGVRQFFLQSGMRYKPDDLAVQVCTNPWWYQSVGNRYRTAFISALVPVTAAVGQLERLQPQVLASYPSILAAMIADSKLVTVSSLDLVVTHSETSSRYARRRWASEIDVPVLDEYSSEEATRIALELPCGHYHACEDTVYLEVLNPDSGRPQKAGEPGVAVVTNLLNEAMPFIRYVQDDFVSLASAAESCTVTWRQLASVDGRRNDSFVTPDGALVPAGTILDLTYRWMYDSDVHIEQFEIVQRRTDLVQLRYVPSSRESEHRISRSLTHLKDLLVLTLGSGVQLVSEMCTDIVRQDSLKRRPIRSEVSRSTPAGT